MIRGLCCSEEQRKEREERKEQRALEREKKVGVTAGSVCVWMRCILN